MQAFGGTWGSEDLYSPPGTCLCPSYRPIRALRGTEDQSSKFCLGRQTPLTKQVKSLGVSQVELPHSGCVGDAVTETKKETVP